MLKHVFRLSASFIASRSPRNDRTSSTAYTSATYTRRPAHTPNTAAASEKHSVLTLHTSSEHQAAITALRQQYFPPHLNKLSAHITLFRALPSSQLPSIEADILSLCAKFTPFTVVTGKPFLLSKRGVGIHCFAPLAQEIYSELKRHWEGFLSEQDKGGFRPHYTIQNKVEHDVAKRTLAEIQERGVEGRKGEVDGLTLWQYDKGYWRNGREFLFGIKDQNTG